MMPSRLVALTTALLALAALPCLATPISTPSTFYVFDTGQTWEDFMAQNGAMVVTEQFTSGRGQADSNTMPSGITITNKRGTRNFPQNNVGSGYHFNAVSSDGEFASLEVEITWQELERQLDKQLGLVGYSVVFNNEDFDAFGPGLEMESAGRVVPVPCISERRVCDGATLDDYIPFADGDPLIWDDSVFNVAWDDDDTEINLDFSGDRRFALTDSDHSGYYRFAIQTDEDDPTVNAFDPGDKITIRTSSTVLDPAGNSVDSTPLLSAPVLAPSVPPYGIYQGVTRYQNFAIDEISLAFVEVNPATTPIPLPPALPVLMVGVGALALIQRRQHSER